MLATLRCTTYVAVRLLTSRSAIPARNWMSSAMVSSAASDFFSTAASSLRAPSSAKMEMLEDRLRCPRCGSRYVRVLSSRPPQLSLSPVAGASGGGGSILIVTP